MKDPKEHWHRFNEVLLYVTLAVTYIVINIDDSKPDKKLLSSKSSESQETSNKDNHEKKLDGEPRNATGKAQSPSLPEKSGADASNSDYLQGKWLWDALYPHFLKLRYYTPVVVLVCLTWFYRAWLWRKLFPENDFSGFWLSVAEYNDNCNVHVWTAGTETAGTETAGTETAGTETAGTETAGTMQNEYPRPKLQVSGSRSLLNIVRIDQTLESLELTDGLALFPPQPFLYYSVAMVPNWEWEVMHVSYEVDELDHTADQSSMERLKFYPPIHSELSIFGRIANVFVSVIDSIPLFTGIARTAVWDERMYKVNYMDGDFTRGRTNQAVSIEDLKWGRAYYVRIPDHLLEYLTLSKNKVSCRTPGFWDLPIPFVILFFIKRCFLTERKYPTEKKGITATQLLFIDTLLSRKFFNPGHTECLSKIEKELKTYFVFQQNNHPELSCLQTDEAFEKELISERVEKWKNRECVWFSWGALIALSIFAFWLPSCHFVVCIAIAFALGAANVSLLRFLVWLVSKFNSSILNVKTDVAKTDVAKTDVAILKAIEPSQTEISGTSTSTLEDEFSGDTRQGDPGL